MTAFMLTRPHLMLPGSSEGGYSYGVEALGVGWVQAELHGGFESFEQAAAYRDELLREHDDYEYAKVVKIETPEAFA